jgi:glyoxylase-like metal-dependent hydrolase (beta-lactamase superfamily II)
MIVLNHAGGIAMTNSFLVADATTKTAVLFDAPDHTLAPLLREVSQRGWNLAGLWLTHGHFDHFADHALVKAQSPDAQILVHAEDEPKVRNPALQLRLFGIPLVIPALKPDALLADNQTLRLGSIEVRVLHTPGHSAGHVVYYFPSEKTLVGGDMIIGGSIGRTDLPDSDDIQMAASLKRIMALPRETRLLPGHGPESTLAEEYQTNSYLRHVLEQAP